MTQQDFVTRVRAGRIKQPTQRGFSIQEWDEAFSQTEIPTVADSSLHKAGIWFNEKLSKVRVALAELGTLGIPPDEAVCVNVGAVNFLTHQLISNHLKEINTLLGGEATAISNADAEDLGVTVQSGVSEQLEAVVSAARLTIARAVTDSRRFEEDEEPSGPVALAKIQATLNLATLYDVLEYLWGECLWNGWYVISTSQFDLVVPEERTFVEASALSERRRDELIAQLGTIAYRVWSRSPSQFKKAVVQSPRIHSVVQEGLHKRFETGPGDHNSDSPPFEHIAEVVAEELYFGTLLSQDLPDFGGLTLRSLVAAWVLFAPLAAIETERYPDLETVDELPGVLEYCPTFERADLERAIVEALQFTDQQAKRIMDLLTFSVKGRSDLWLTPFVPVSDSKTALVVEALRSPNLLRSVEHWSKEGGLDLGSRGEVFEQLVRRQLKERNRLASFEIYQRPLTLVVGNAEEEIDLSARLGNTVIIGECKCSVYPAEPVEFHNYFATLRKAASQAKRKGAFVKDNLSAFLRTAGFRDVDENNAEIIPVVVTNLPLGVGHTFDEVPVTDLLILRRFVDEGEVGHEAYYDGAEQIVARGKTVFYTSEVEAERVLLDYLRSPPQLQSFERFLKAEVRPLLQIADEDKSAGFVNVFVDVPTVMPLPQ